jgi:hypothetical protein
MIRENTLAAAPSFFDQSMESDLEAMTDGRWLRIYAADR